ncbi:MAG: hypothetical protein LBE12_15405 [Planctomycetaceae bacterium]|nr:hypothetical protein [Planctomycetaceae bacterium]
MSQSDYYQNGNHSACDTIHSQLSTPNYSMLPFQGVCFWGNLKPAPLGRAIILTPLAGLI